MTKNEVLKKLLRFNLKMLEAKLSFNMYLHLKIEFNDEEFIVSNNFFDKIILLKDKISNYNLNFESQKIFVLKIARKLCKFVKDNETAEYEKIDTSKLKDVFIITGYKNIMYKNLYIKIDVNKLIKCWEVDIKFEEFLDNILKKIYYNLDWEKIDVAYHKNEKCFYVNIVMNEINLPIEYVDYENINEINNMLYITKEKLIKIYYSNIDIKEAIKTDKYIKELLYG